jgi:hypothetical protein
MKKAVDQIANSAHMQLWVQLSQVGSKLAEPVYSEAVDLEHHSIDTFEQKNRAGLDRPQTALKNAQLVHLEQLAATRPDHEVLLERVRGQNLKAKVDRSLLKNRNF